MVTSLVYKITTLYSKYRNTQPLMTQVSTSLVWAWDREGKVTGVVACWIIVSAPVLFPFLWTSDLGFEIWIWDLNLGLEFGTWIWDLDLGLGFRTGLGLDKKYNTSRRWL